MQADNISAWTGRVTRPERPTISQPKASPWVFVYTSVSPRRGKRIKSSFPFPQSFVWVLILLPFQGVIPAASFPAGRCPGLTYHCPFGAQTVQADMLSAGTATPQPSNLLNCIAARIICSFVLLSNSKEGAWWTLDNATEAYCYHNNMPLSSFSRDVSWYNLSFKII